MHTAFSRRHSFVPFFYMFLPGKGKDGASGRSGAWWARSSTGGGESASFCSFRFS